MTTTRIPFVPTNEWQECLPNHIFPPGLRYHMDMPTEKTYATWDRGAATPLFIPPPRASVIRPMEQVALRYAALGRPVFPVQYIKQDGSCSCGNDPCGRSTPEYPHGTGAGKHPATRNGFKDATTDPATVRRWWGRWPYNIGLRVKENEIILDVDVRSGGLPSLEALQAKHGALPDTVQSFTGGGGQHWFFEYPGHVHLPAGGSLGNVGFPGVEWKAQGGGYVVAPPSKHYTGGEYAWEASSALGEVPEALIPEWLLDLLVQASGHKSSYATKGATNEGDKRDSRWNWLDVVGFFQGTYSEGSRRTATGLPRLVGILASRGHVPEAQALEFLLDWQESHFSPPLEPTDLTAQVMAMYARWGPLTDTGGGDDFLRRLRAGMDSLPPDVPTSRIPPHIRDVGTSLDQDEPDRGEQEATPLSVARQAAALAGNYRAEAISLFPQLPGLYARGGSKAMRRKDDHKHLAIHSGSSETWQEPGNAVLKRRKVFQFYSPLLWDIVERLKKGAVYHFRRHLSPETVSEDARYTTNLHSRIKRHHGNYVDFTILEEDGWWIHTFSDYDDRHGATEPTVAAQEDFGIWLQGLGPPEEEYHRRYPVMASEEWKMPKSRTNEWEALGSRHTPDISRYREIEDIEDAEAAAQRHIKTWVASEAEVMGRAPDDIVHTRHFQGGVSHTAKSMLSFLKNDLGFFLYPKAMAELEAPEPNTSPWDHAAKPPTPPKQARLEV